MLVIEVINKIMWAVATALIFLSGLFFTIKLKGIQFNFKAIFQSLFNKNYQSHGITPMQSFFMTLGSRIGVGSIAGVSLALYIGGPGSIFWMWVSAFLAASITFSETVLGVIYRKKDGNDYKGGPPYYIKDGLHKPILGGLYAILILVSYVGGFVGIQGNTITKSIREICPLPNFVIGILLVLVTSLIIFGGLKKIAAISEKIVPFMTLLYLLVAIYVSIKNLSLIPKIFIDIVKSAFTLKSVYGGFIWSLIIGFQRGIFSSEAGLGTGSITSSASATKSPTNQGYMQVLGIYVTTLLICTSTVIIVMTSNYHELVLSDINGIEITTYAFKYHLGSLGNLLLIISVLLFSFTTILTGYYDGESCLKYFIKKIKKTHVNILKIVSLVLLFLGCITSSTLLWSFVDILMAILAIINIYALFKLKENIFSEVNYSKNNKSFTR